LRDNVEVSFNVKSEVSVQFTLSINLPVIFVDDIPLLVKTLVLAIDNDGSVLSINCT